MNKKATRSQVKEAFRGTLDRWEKIVKDPSYHSDTFCQLCTLELDYPAMSQNDQRCNESCPIRSYNEGYHYACSNTPYSAFTNYQTTENAQAELDFLREVYVDFLEKELKESIEHIKACKASKAEAEEEKKPKEPKWKDITNDLRLHKSYDARGVDGFYLEDECKNIICWVTMQKWEQGYSGKYNDVKIEGGKVLVGEPIW